MSRLIFAGTPQFAVPSLRVLHRSSADVIAVLTQPDRRQGRGRQLAAPPVKQFAEMHGIQVIQAAKITPDILYRIQALKPDLIVVAAFGLILPQDFLDIPELGCVNVHASLLPRWRGAAPIARAIEAGDRETGISIMQMDSGLDTGDIFSQSVLPIHPRDTAASLQEDMAEAGARELGRILPNILAQNIKAVAQDHSTACYAHKLKVSEAGIDWTLTAYQIVHKIQAFNPWPVARTWHQKTCIRVWEAETRNILSTGASPGEILADAKGVLSVATGDGAVRLRRVQKEGKRQMDDTTFLSGTALAAGSLLKSD